MRSQHPTDVLERENEALRRFIEDREFIRALRWAREMGKVLSTREREILALADEEGRMLPTRTVSYYREMETVAITVKTGRLKFFVPTCASTRRLRKTLESLHRQKRIDVGFASIYGGGVHIWVDPKWLRSR